MQAEALEPRGYICGKEGKVGQEMESGDQRGLWAEVRYKPPVPLDYLNYRGLEPESAF